jgi:tellurite resistance protein
MLMQQEHVLKKQAKDLEETFFAKENERLLRELRAKAKIEDRRNALKAVVKVKDEAIIDHLLELGVGPESVLAVGLVPLAAVAWADGRMEDKERKAILKAASERGVKPGTANYTMLEVWLREKPNRRLIEAWKKYARGIWEQLTEQERILMREGVVGRAREIAEAAGGFLGLQAISAKEKAVLEELERILS